MGAIVWQKANGPGSPRILLQPAIAGLELPDVGSGWDHLLVTRTLLISGQSGPNKQNEAVLVARDKPTGAVIAELVLPGRVQAPPVTYMAGGDQYITVVIAGSPPEVLALRLPDN